MLKAQKLQESAEEEKITLRLEIRALKLYIAQQENILNSFRQRSLLKKRIKTVQLPMKGIAEDQTIAYNRNLKQLCNFAGVSCDINDSSDNAVSFLIQFSRGFNLESLAQDTGKYWIVIEHRIGVWRFCNSQLPVSVEPMQIIPNFDLNTAEGMKEFLMECKLRMLCHHNRCQQYKRVKILLSNMPGYETHTNLGYTRMKLIVVKNSEPETEFHIKLSYKSDEGRPFRLVLHYPNDKLGMSESEIEKLRLHVIKIFDDFDLREATSELITIINRLTWKFGDVQILSENNNKDVQITFEKSEVKFFEDDCIVYQIDLKNSVKSKRKFKQPEITLDSPSPEKKSRNSITTQDQENLTQSPALKTFSSLRAWQHFRFS